MNMHKLDSNGHFCKGLLSFDRNKVFCSTFFAVIIYSPKPNIRANVREINDLSCITSCLSRKDFKKKKLSYSRFYCHICSFRV